VRLAAAFITIFTIPLGAQTSVPAGFVRGVLLVSDATRQGEFSVQTGTGQICRFTFDARTWIERDHERVFMAVLQKGEILEVVSDRDPAIVPYARMVHVVQKPVPKRPPTSAGLYRLQRNPIEFLAPRGDMTFSGIISNLQDDHLILRTRSAGEKLIYLRKDTRYLDSGFQVEPGVLRSNTRVFVRAGKNLDDEIEAYQVIWGEIFEPASPRY